MREPRILLKQNRSILKPHLSPISWAIEYRHSYWTQSSSDKELVSWLTWRLKRFPIHGEGRITCTCVPCGQGGPGNRFSRDRRNYWTPRLLSWTRTAQLACRPRVDSLFLLSVALECGQRRTLGRGPRRRFGPFPSSRCNAMLCSCYRSALPPWFGNLWYFLHIKRLFNCFFGLHACTIE